MTRRAFIKTATAAAVASATWTNAVATQDQNWTIGCFNRAWTNWDYDDALDGIAAAGYKLTGFLSGHRRELFTSSSATPDYLEKLKKRIMQQGLTVNTTALRFRPEAPLEENIADLRKQIENAARLELKFMLTFGVDKPEHSENFYRLMSDAARQAEKHGVQITIKPHGGTS